MRKYKESLPPSECLIDNVLIFSDICGACDDESVTAGETMLVLAGVARRLEVSLASLEIFSLTHSIRPRHLTRTNRVS